MLLQWCRLFFRYFFEPAKQHWAGGMGEKGSHCPMLLSEIVWKSYVKYVVSFYVMWISTLLQSHVRAPPVQRWRCTILNKIITAATAVKLHGNRCSLNHVDLHYSLICLNYQTERIGVARNDYKWCSIVIIEQIELICQLLISVWTVHHQKM